MIKSGQGAKSRGGVGKDGMDVYGGSLTDTFSRAGLDEMDGHLWLVGVNMPLLS